MVLNSGQWGILQPGLTFERRRGRGLRLTNPVMRNFGGGRLLLWSALSVLLWSCTLCPVQVKAQELAVGLSVKVAERAYRPGDSIQFTLIHAGKEPVALAGCATYVLERFEEDRYTTVWQKRCEWEQDALLFSPGERSFELPAPTGKPSLLRVTFPYGVGCREGVPLSRAACKKFGVISSSPFSLLQEAP